MKGSPRSSSCRESASTPTHGNHGIEKDKDDESAQDVKESETRSSKNNPSPTFQNDNIIRPSHSDDFLGVDIFPKKSRPSSTSHASNRKTMSEPQTYSLRPLTPASRSRFSATSSPSNDSLEHESQWCDFMWCCDRSQANVVVLHEVPPTPASPVTTPRTAASHDSCAGSRKSIPRPAAVVATETVPPTSKLDRPIQGVFAVTIIQRYWRGYQVRCLANTPGPTAVRILRKIHQQRRERKEREAPRIKQERLNRAQRHYSAFVIQSHWRHYHSWQRRLAERGVKSLSTPSAPPSESQREEDRRTLEPLSNSIAISSSNLLPMRDIVEKLSPRLHEQVRRVFQKQTSRQNLYGNAVLRRRSADYQPTTIPPPLYEIRRSHSAGELKATLDTVLQKNWGDIGFSPTNETSAKASFGKAASQFDHMRDMFSISLPRSHEPSERTQEDEVSEPNDEDIVFPSPSQATFLRSEKEKSSESLQETSLVKSFPGSSEEENDIDSVHSDAPTSPGSSHAYALPASLSSPLERFFDQAKQQQQKALHHDEKDAASAWDVLGSDSEAEEKRMSQQKSIGLEMYLDKTVRAGTPSRVGLSVESLSERSLGAQYEEGTNSDSGSRALDVSSRGYEPDTSHSSFYHKDQNSLSFEEASKIIQPSIHWTSCEEESLAASRMGASQESVSEDENPDDGAMETSGLSAEAYYGYGAFSESGPSLAVEPERSSAEQQCNAAEVNKEEEIEEMCSVRASPKPGEKELDTLELKIAQPLADAGADISQKTTLNETFQRHADSRKKSTPHPAHTLLPMSMDESSSTEWHKWKSKKSEDFAQTEVKEFAAGDHEKADQFAKLFVVASAQGAVEDGILNQKESNGDRSDVELPLPPPPVPQVPDSRQVYPRDATPKSSSSRKRFDTPRPMLDSKDSPGTKRIYRETLARLSPRLGHQRVAPYTSSDKGTPVGRSPSNAIGRSDEENTEEIPSFLRAEKTKQKVKDILRLMRERSTSGTPSRQGVGTKGEVDLSGEVMESTWTEATGIDKQEEVITSTGSKSYQPPVRDSRDVSAEKRSETRLIVKKFLNKLPRSESPTKVKEDFYGSPTSGQGGEKSPDKPQSSTEDEDFDKATNSSKSRRTRKSPLRVLRHDSASKYVGHADVQRIVADYFKTRDSPPLLSEGASRGNSFELDPDSPMSLGGTTPRTPRSWPTPKTHYQHRTQPILLKELSPVSSHEFLVSSPLASPLAATRLFPSTPNLQQARRSSGKTTLIPSTTTTTATQVEKSANQTGREQTNRCAYRIRRPWHWPNKSRRFSSMGKSERDLGEKMRETMGNPSTDSKLEKGMSPLGTADPVSGPKSSVPPYPSSFDGENIPLEVDPGDQHFLSPTSSGVGVDVNDVDEV